MLEHFVMTPEWIEIKETMIKEIVDKPLDIDTKGKTAEMIALEVRASQLAVEKILKIIKKFDSFTLKQKLDVKPYR